LWEDKVNTGDLVKIRGDRGGPVRNLIPELPRALGILIPDGTPAVVLETGPTSSRVLLESKLLWIYNNDMEVISESR
jgi:hypothetical protein